MVYADDLVQFLDQYLDLKAFKDYSQNGVQVQGANRIKRVVGLVDASLAGFQAAVDAGADMIIVHHGLLWGKSLPITGSHFQRIKLLIDNNICLYAAHLPLDAHAEIGNNIGLTDIIEADFDHWYAEFGGRPIGSLATFKKPQSLAAIVDKLDAELSTSTRLYSFGPDLVRTVGIISGSACDAIDVTAAEGADLFITGEAKLTAFHQANELDMSIAFAGHYATETVGIKSLLEILPQQFEVESLFIDIPCDI